MEEWNIWLIFSKTNNVSEDLDDVTETTLLYREDVNVPPCIALNTTDDSVGKVELVVITIFGLLLQSGLLVFDAMTVYYWGWKKGGDDIATYAFPLVLVGTLILSIGMFLCAFVIDSSTVEKTYPISDEAKKQIVWLQKGQTVNDQRFRSYAIFAAKGRNKIVTSHRATDKDLGSLTTVASIVSIFGECDKNITEFTVYYCTLHGHI